MPPARARKGIPTGREALSERAHLTRRCALNGPRRFIMSVRTWFGPRREQPARTDTVTHRTLPAAPGTHLPCVPEPASRDER